MKLELRSVSLWSFIKISVFVNLILGFIIGLVYAVFMLIFMSLFAKLGGIPLQGFDYTEMSGAFMLIVMPIMFSLGAALFGTIWGVVCVLTYNLITMLTGGLQINVDDVSVPDYQQPPKQPVTDYTAQTEHDSQSAPPPTTPPEQPKPNENNQNSPI
ncbi:MAG: hypothetical protein U9N55_01875 [candidate division Zixibacteria bacterium]|nr:hypothetical protein [candidate division Zixibacteria bacterium]